jgi:amino acid transporter
MTNKYEALKRSVILMYVLLTSALLYAISLTGMSNLDEAAFSRFAVFFWGSCFSFHYLSMLLPVRANESNSSHWLSLAGQLAILLSIIAFTFLLMLGVANAVIILNLSAWIYVCLAIFIFGSGVSLSIANAMTFHQKLNLLLISKG